MSGANWWPFGKEGSTHSELRKSYHPNLTANQLAAMSSNAAKHHSIPMFKPTNVLYQTRPEKKKKPHHFHHHQPKPHPSDESVKSNKSVRSHHLGVLAKGVSSLMTVEGVRKIMYDPKDQPHRQRSGIIAKPKCHKKDLRFIQNLPLASRKAALERLDMNALSPLEEDEDEEEDEEEEEEESDSELSEEEEEESEYDSELSTKNVSSKSPSKGDASRPSRPSQPYKKPDFTVPMPDKPPAKEMPKNYVFCQEPCYWPVYSQQDECQQCYSNQKGPTATRLSDLKSLARIQYLPGTGVIPTTDGVQEVQGQSLEGETNVTLNSDGDSNKENPSIDNEKPEGAIGGSDCPNVQNNCNNNEEEDESVEFPAEETGQHCCENEACNYCRWWYYYNYGCVPPQCFCNCVCNENCGGFYSINIHLGDLTRSYLNQ